ncbi:hypothetical protein HDV64DRAFT_115251 [Trichoderma sp. TUCIM 5745]
MLQPEAYIFYLACSFPLQTSLSLFAVDRFWRLFCFFIHLFCSCALLSQSNSFSCTAVPVFFFLSLSLCLLPSPPMLSSNLLLANNKNMPRKVTNSPVIPQLPSIQSSVSGPRLTGTGSLTRN